MPNIYKKLAFIDCDVVFESNNWYSLTSQLLDNHDVVQPFHTAQWMAINYTNGDLNSTLNHLIT